jgi:Tol biopolymer transport system component
MRPTAFEPSPDGKQLFFVGVRAGGGTELYRMPVTGGRPVALGAKPGIGNFELSRDGSQVVYGSFEGGWAFVDVMPAAGGTPRRITKETEGVFQANASWTLDGSTLVIGNLDLAGNRDATDIRTVRLSDGVSQPLTSTPMVSEFLAKVAPDGQLVVVTVTNRNSIRRVQVADLLIAR